MKLLIGGSPCTHCGDPAGDREAAGATAPVVRCKDCKHLVAVNVNGKGIPTCRVSGMEVAPDEFWVFDK